jgi:LL-diaminopimelate aminotransferase
MQNSTNNTASPVKEYFFVGAQRQKQELIRQGRRIADLSIGNPDMPPPAEVLDRLKESLLQPQNHGYQPNAGSSVLRNAVASWYNRFFDAEVNPDGEMVPFRVQGREFCSCHRLCLNPVMKFWFPIRVILLTHLLRG